jgi:suppressor of fused
MSDSPRDDAAPGWDAITDAMAAIHGPQEPRHWAAGSTLPGASGLYGLSAYDADDHWHFVTFGLSELWAKESEDREVSGFGYELTMRTSHQGEEPRDWTVKLLQRLGDLIFEGTVFRPGHTLDAGTPITGEATSDLTGLVFALDPELGSIETPNGSLDFVQVVGISGDELASIKADRSVLASMQTRNPLLITVLDH